MGLFNFIKNAGSGLLKKKAASYGSKERSTDAIRERQEGLLEGIIEGSGVGVKDVDIEIIDDIVTIWGTAESHAAKEKAILILGNMDGVASIDDRLSVLEADVDFTEGSSAPSAPSTSGSSEMYEVKSGDSLSKIAKNFYGDPMKYKMIFEANQPMLKDPNLIYPGQMLRIPKA